MPRGDRTGPAGAGPLTGRRAGWCGGNQGPGYANLAPGGFARRGFGGGGRGWRNMYYATGIPGWARGAAAPQAMEPSDELADLRSQAGWLAEQLEVVRRRIDALGGGTPQS